jgi:hypothetical protein
MRLWGRGKEARDQAPAERAVEAQFGPGELAIALRPLVMAPDQLPPAAVQGAPEPLPGLVMATAVRRGDQVDFVPTFSMDDLGGVNVVWATAKKNVESLHGVQIGREPVDPSRDDTEVVYLWGDDPFVASRVTVLSWLIEELGLAPATHGALVALPHIRSLMLHVVKGAGVLKVQRAMAALAAQRFARPGVRQAISPDVYFVAPDGRGQRVAHSSADRMELHVTGAFGEVLFGPPPRGLGLSASAS